MNEYNHFDKSDINIGEVIYFIDDLNTPIVLYDILSSVYPDPRFLYYICNDERPYKRESFYTKTERRKILINKLLEKNE